MSYTSGGTTEVTDYTYDANSRLTNEATSVAGDIKSAIRYYYDENGNTTAEQKSVYTTTGTQSSNMSMSGHSGGSTMKLYRYDEFNRLVKYNDDGTEATYTYSANNLRATKTVNSTTTDFVWNGQNLASETKNNATTVYYYDPLGVNGAKTDNDTFVRYIKDPHGNIVATSKNSTLYDTYNYTYYVDGNQKSKSESVAGSDKGTTNYTYDGVNRLVTEQAPDKTLNYQYDSYGNRSQLSVTGDEMKRRDVKSRVFLFDIWTDNHIAISGEFLILMLLTIITIANSP